MLLSIEVFTDRRCQNSSEINWSDILPVSNMATELKSERETPIGQRLIIRHLSTFFSTVPWQMVAWPSSDYVLLLLAKIVVHMEEFKSNWQHITDHLNICLMRQSTVSVIEVRSSGPSLER